MEREDSVNNFLSSRKGKKLLNLDKKILVETLYRASLQNENVHSTLERLASRKDEHYVRFRKKLEKYTEIFIPRHYTEAFARQLEELLFDLKESDLTPEEGLSLIKEFFEADGNIIESCDDSDGEIEIIFNCDAANIFRKYAKQCKNKEWVSDILFNLVIKDEYGLRDELSIEVGEFLPEKEIRRIIDKLWKLYKSKKIRSTSLLERMAWATKDPLLYEKVIKLGGGSDYEIDLFKLGEMWLFCGDPKKALSYLQKINKDNFWDSVDEVNELLLEIYKKLGDKKKQKEIVWEAFRDDEYRTKEKFDEVIAIEGKNKRQKLLKNEVALIFQNKQLDIEDVNFMLELELIDEAGDYIFNRKQYINGNHYNPTIWADIFSHNQKPLIATILYRALLNSILEGGKSKAYQNGADYLHCLDSLSKDIKDWMGIQTHDAYFLEIKKNNKRKYNFWNQYDKGRL